MQAEGSGLHIMRFGVFDVDLKVGELRKKGVRVRLQEQPLQVLALLLQKPGEIVTREQFRQRLWNGGVIVDFDHSLNTTINKLREALDDSADTPRFIETIPRRGYRFIYPVNGASAPGINSERPPARWSRRWAMLAGVSLAALLAFAALSPGLRGALFQRPAPSDITSIAVLPLRNLSGDPEQDHFADGMTEALITELGKVSALQVLSYRSVASYRQSAEPLAQIVQELRVGAVLEGTVLQSGARVRVTANLVQASPERQLWADSYEFELRDVLGVQGTVAREVASRVRARVTQAERSRLTSSRRVDSEAYEAYLLGRAHMRKMLNAASWAKAKEYFEKAIAKDPAYGAAYAGLAELHIRHRGSTTQNPRDARAEARRLAEVALQLDDTLSEAHTTLARIAQQDEWDWAAAERGYRRAIELNPSDAEARIRYAMFLYAMLRSEEAVVEARRAQQLDPVSPFVNTWAGAAYFQAGRLAEGTASCRKALELDPSFTDASLVLARTFVSHGNHAQAIAELEQAMGFASREPIVVGALAHAYARAGRREAALKLVDTLKHIEAQEPGYLPPYGLIWAYAALGESDKAFAYLEISYRKRTDRMVFLNADTLLDPLRSDPRFKDLIRRVGLPKRSTS